MAIGNPKQINEDELLVDEANIKDEIDIKNRIDKKLKKIQLPELETLKPEFVSYLIRIESAIIDIEDERKNYISKYRNTKANINTIADRTGISRTTLYKYNDIFPVYIKYAQYELQENDILKESDSQTKIINELEEEIRKLQFKSLKEQKLLDKIEMKQNEYNNLLEQVKNLQLENSRLYSEINKLKTKKTGKFTEIF